MPEVTAIKRRVLSGKVNFQISLDGVYAFSLSDLDLSNSGLRMGQNISHEQACDLEGRAQIAKAYGLCLRYIGLRLRSRKELLDYLARKGCEMDDAESALSQLEPLGLIDDLRFATAWVADRQALRPRSSRRLAQELAAKGIDREIITRVLASTDPEDEFNALKALILRKRAYTQYKDARKLVAYFQRQGYRWTLIKEVMEQLAKEVD
jgi:regulatory protein